MKEDNDMVSHIYHLPNCKEKKTMPPYRINWFECFLIVACLTLFAVALYHGVIALAMILAGMS